MPNTLDLEPIGVINTRDTLRRATPVQTALNRSEQGTVVLRPAYTGGPPSACAPSSVRSSAMLEDRFPDIAAMLDDAAEDLVAFTGFPQTHWRKIWSTNPLERVNGEIKRRINVVGIFPNDAAVARLVTDVVLEPLQPEPTSTTPRGVIHREGVRARS